MDKLTSCTLAGMMRRTVFFASLLLTAFAAAQPHPLLQSGPMLGYAEMTEVAIWVQTKGAAKAQIEYRKLGATDWIQSETLSTFELSDHIATFTLSGLPLGTKFEYRLKLNGQEVRRDYPLTFQTQPHWRWATRPPQPPNAKIAIGSCAYFNDPVSGFDRPGEPYGGDYEIFSAIHKAKPDLMLWLGDNIYYREPDWLTEKAMRNRWRIDRAHPSIQPLLGSVHNYATWDDHDFGPNDSDSSFRLRDAALRIHRDYWPQVVYGNLWETPGVFTRFEWGDVEVFMLDDRYHRSPNNMPPGPEKRMFGRGQLEWLKRALVNSDKTFKLICNGNQMIQPLERAERFNMFPAEQKELFDFIAQSRVEGVVFFSGDRHHTELLKVQWPGAAYPWFEYTSSPLTSGTGARPNEIENPARVPGTFVTNTRNFGMLETSGPWQDRQLTMTAHDKTGKELWKHVIREKDLKAPK
jgi:alkaline phosphatase D